MKFTWVYVLCFAVVGASAQSFESGFRLNGFDNLNGRCDNGFGVIETSPLNFAIARPTCDCVVRPQIRKEIIAVPSVQRFFQPPCNPLVQTVPIFGGRNIPALPFSSPKVFVPAPVVDARNGGFSPIPIGGFRGILNGAFLGNSLGVAPELGGSFTGSLDAGFIAGGAGVVLPGSSVVGGGFTNGELSNNC